MNVLFHVGYPLAWARGGHAVQILETQRALEACGVAVHWLHHEAATLPDADILHYWSRPPNDSHWQLARQRGLKVVISELHQTGVLRPRWTWPLRRAFAAPLRRLMGRGLWSTLGADIYPHCDAAVAVTRIEADYMTTVFGAPEHRTHVIPNGVDPVFKDPAVPPEPFDGLVCIAHICERKNNLELAHAAKVAQVPVRFAGAPLVPGSDYFHAFAGEVDDRFVHWAGETATPRRTAAILRGARGLVLASRNEGLPLVVLEALAAGTPVLLSDLPNMRAVFGDAVSYCPPADAGGFDKSLRAFWEDVRGGRRAPAFEVPDWHDVGRQYAALYQDILDRP